MNSAKNKGAEGEREIAKLLNNVVRKCLEQDPKYANELDNPELYVQRNTIQCAIGGKDLTNTYGLAIEVKRQEALSVGAWWKQAVTSANRLSEQPVLIYRQNRKGWRVMMNIRAEVAYPFTVDLQVEMPMDQFLIFFENTVRLQLLED